MRTPNKYLVISLEVGEFFLSSGPPRNHEIKCKQKNNYNYKNFNFSEH